MKIQIKGIGELCPKCVQPMQRREHTHTTFNKMSKQTHYFKEWDYCKSCKHIQHYEKFKEKIERPKTIWNQ